MNGWECLLYWLLWYSSCLFISGVKYLLSCQLNNVPQNIPQTCPPWRITLFFAEVATLQAVLKSKIV